jgi:hypothetical protein
MVASLARAADAARARHPNRSEQGGKLGSLVALARSQDYRERTAPAIAGEMNLGAQHASASPKSLVLGVGYPLFSSS